MVGFGLNLVATTRINQLERPTIRDFENAEILVVNYATWQDELSIGWNYSIGIRKEKDFFDWVGRIIISQSFDPHDYTSSNRYGYRGVWKNWIIDVIDMQLASEREKVRPTKKVRVKDFMKNRFWFW